MFRHLDRRTGALELMDDFSSGGEELLEALRHLRRLNRIFAAASPTVHGVQRLWHEAGKPEKLTILDVGAGSGDVNRRLLRWANKYGIALRITLIDITEEACQEARHFFRGEPRVRVERRDLFELAELAEFQADIVTGTQFVHHFSGDELPKVVGCMLRISRLGVVLNDIHRHWMPWSAVWLTTRLISRNRYIRHDGPLSVAKGFRAQDWRTLRDELGLPGMLYGWRPLFRYVVIVPKDKSNLPTKVE